MGCSHVPALKRLFPGPYYPYISNPRFSFEYPRKWGEGRSVPGGIRFRHPSAPVSFSISFLQEGHPEYKPPELFRQYMAAWGAVEDSRVVSDVNISSRPARQVFFTTYQYDPGYLLGARFDVLYSEVIAVPDPEGMYVIRYDADRERFWRRRYRRHFEHFLETLVLAHTRRS